MAGQSFTYAGTGAQTEMDIPVNNDATINIVAGATDVFSIQTRTENGVNWVSSPSYTDISGNQSVSITGPIEALRLNITTNTSGAIMMDVGHRYGGN